MNNKGKYNSIPNFGSTAAKTTMPTHMPTDKVTRPPIVTPISLFQQILTPAKKAHLQHGILTRRDELR
ncbi:hypothetical protein ACA910_000371 [Epithemia clementina (nom. ined.)]